MRLLVGYSLFVPPKGLVKTSFPVLVPFSGFYYSIHSDAIDSTEEQMFSNVQGIIYYELYEDFWKHVNYEDVRNNYARAYTEAYAKYTGIALKFDELTSPREYNFETDRIFAEISRSDVAKMLWKVRGKKLDKVVKEMFTSRSGFISFYSNDIRDWGKVETWDHNQIGAILFAYDDCKMAEDSANEEIICNGEIDNWIYNATDRIGKLTIDFAAIIRKYF